MKNIIVKSFITALVLIIISFGILFSERKPVLTLLDFFNSFRKKITRNNNKPIAPPKGKVKVFIFMGQSNMVGHGSPDELTGKYKKYSKMNNRILMFQDNGWVPLGGYRFGPEIACAYEMAEFYPDHTIGVIKVAWGGTSITAFLPDWTKEKAGKHWYKGPLYKFTVELIEKAGKTADVEFCGMYWKQGGADMHSMELAEPYLERLKKIILELRKDSGNKNLPVFIGTYVKTDEDIESFEKQLKASGSKRANKAKELFTVMNAQNRISKELPNVYTVIHGRLPCIKPGTGNVHFNTEGQITLGKMFAEATIKHYDKK